MRVGKIIKGLLPPVIAVGLHHLLHRKIKPICFTGDYKDWEEAEQNSTGYSKPEILAKTRDALLKVKRGEAAFERDSITFNVIQYEFPLLAGLLRAATSSGNRLSVLDFGGSLGSTYFQCREFLSMLTELRWSVVEQPAHVTCGQTDFANEQLHFYRTIDECLQSEKPNVLLLSSVMQYLPKPYEFLHDILQRKWKNVIIDRTGFLLERGDHLTVQHVPDYIYRASYPVWFFSEERFLSVFQKEYDLIATFSALDKLQPKGKKADYKGFIFSLKD